MVNVIFEKLAGLSVEDLKKQRFFCRFMGCLFLVAGIACLLAPATSSIMISILVGWLFLFSGIFHGIGAILLRKAVSVWALVLGIVLGLAYVFVGHQFIAYPVMGAMLLSLFIGTLFIASGVIRGTALFMVMPPQRGRWVFVGSAVMEVLLGVLIVSGWPGNSSFFLAVLLSMQLFLGSRNYFSLAGMMSEILTGQKYS